MRQGRGVANKSYILSNPEAAAEGIVAAAMKPPGRSIRGRPQPAAPPPPKKKKPPKNPTSTEPATAESLPATPSSASASAPPPKRATLSLNKVLARQQSQSSQSSPKTVLIYTPYTVNWSVLWRGKEVFSRVKSSDKFDFNTFSGEAIKKVLEKADAKGYKTVLQLATAVITCSGNQANIASECGNLEQWDDVNSVAKTWLKEKRKGVTVKILHKYDRKEESSDGESSTSSTPASPPKKKYKALKDKYRFSSDNPSSTETSSSEDSDSDSGLKRKKKRKDKNKKKKTKKSMSTSAKQKEFYRRVEELDRKKGRFGHDLIKRWFYDSAACGNKNHYY